MKPIWKCGGTNELTKYHSVPRQIKRSRNSESEEKHIKKRKRWKRKSWPSKRLYQEPLLMRTMTIRSDFESNPNLTRRKALKADMHG